MIPTREFNLRLASDITGVPPYLLGVPSESRVYANMETEWANFIRVTLGRLLSPLEAALSDCFPRDKQVMFNTDQLMRADSTARWTVYKMAAEIGAVTVDEIRDFEHMPPLPAGAEPIKKGTGNEPGSNDNPDGEDRLD
jgi:phage portal protein BeeE